MLDAAGGNRTDVLALSSGSALEAIGGISVDLDLGREASHAGSERNDMNDGRTRVQHSLSGHHYSRMPETGLPPSRSPQVD